LPTILLTGDVMIGRGIDQILRHPSSPELYEPVVGSANIYVDLAEAMNGPIPRYVTDDYVWGDALPLMRGADVTIVNLETAVTRSDRPAPKGINYRCNPANVGCLTAAGIGCCVLANNHVLDWGDAGLTETLGTLEAAHLRFAGAGRNLAQAAAPAAVPLADGRRVLVYAFGSPTSGIPHSWAASPGRAGVNFLGHFNRAFEGLRARIAADKRPGDITIMSVHWGPNWGYEIPGKVRDFAHRLVGDAQVDIVHGHSSHHAKAIEIHDGKPILYGCGDFLNDYEGIKGEERFHPDLVLAYHIEFDTAGHAPAIELLPFRIARFRLQHATDEEAAWLAATLDRECRRFGGQVAKAANALRMSARAPLQGT
jgi:poly-gamma-glutamate capsule biosynthesis protein CapA/YwtB (metallophosphatase superfamily)